MLAVDPDCYDAYVATGFSKYIIGSMAAPVRWFLRLGGLSGDKKQGIAELQLTADHGRYLGPFARILLAIAYVRDKDNARARGVLAALRDEFPEKSLVRARNCPPGCHALDGGALARMLLSASSGAGAASSCF